MVYGSSQYGILYYNYRKVVYNMCVNSKIEKLLNTAKLDELLHKKELEEKNKNTIFIILAVIGAIAAVAGIAYAVYRYCTPDYLDDFDPDDYSDNFDDDFIEFSDNKPEAED